MKRQAGLAVVLCMCFWILCACSMEDGRSDLRAWSTLTPAMTAEEGEPYKPIAAERAQDDKGVLHCGVSYTLYKDGELLLENSKHTQPN